MEILNELKDRVTATRNRLKKENSREEGIEEYEYEESEEISLLNDSIQKLERIEDLEAFESEIYSVTERLEIISSEIHNTCENLHNIQRAVNSNIQKESEIIEKLDESELQISKRENVEALAEYINITKENSDHFERQVFLAKKEAETALENARNLEQLIKKFLNDSNQNLNDLSANPIAEIRNTIEDLKESRSYLNKIEDGYSENKMSRRRVMKFTGGAATASIMGLSGCMREDCVDYEDLEVSDSQLESGFIKGAELFNQNEIKGKMLDTSKLEGYSRETCRNGYVFNLEILTTGKIYSRLDRKIVRDNEKAINALIRGATYLIYYGILEHPEVFIGETNINRFDFKIEENDTPARIEVLLLDEQLEKILQKTRDIGEEKGLRYIENLVNERKNLVGGAPL